MKLWPVAMVFSVSCSNGQELSFSEVERATLSQYVLDPVPASDPTNRFSRDPAAAHLGQYLFYDSRLSANGEFSCASCHDPDKGFADGQVLSETLGRTGRHASTLLNSAYQDFFYWDGRADSLWSQALSPIENSSEMGGSREAVFELLFDDSELRAAFEAVFGSIDQNGGGQEVDWVFANVGKAIGAYEQLLVRNNAPFDAFVEELLVEERSGSSEISLSAQRGLKDFLGDAGCHFCHFGPQFSNNDFHNIGLAVPAWDAPLDGGRYDGIPTLLSDPFNGMGEFSDDRETGSLKIDHLVQSAEQLGQFKTPGLRNLLSTAPYMHAGHFSTLEEVVAHYSRLESEVELGHREELLLPLEDESGTRFLDLVEFLVSLEGQALDERLLSQPSSPFLGD